jgi:hypothetical protein
LSYVSGSIPQAQREHLEGAIPGNIHTYKMDVFNLEP